MATKLKVIKKKSFDVAGQPHTHYTAAYKGRVFGVSTLRWDEGLTENADNTITLDSCEVVKRTNVDNITGEVSTFLDLVPKLDVVLAEI